MRLALAAALGLALLGAQPAAANQVPIPIHPRCTIVGTSGADVLRGTPGSDVICGGPGRDRLFGGRGDDYLYGGGGDDILVPGGGRNHLFPGPGQNTCRPLGTERLVPGCGNARGRGWLVKGDECCFGKAPPPRCPPPAKCEGGAPAPPPDVTPPAIGFVAFRPDSVDVSGGDSKTVLYLNPSDESGVESAVVRIDGPDGLWKQLELPGSREIEKELSVPATTAAGDYSVAELTLTDTVGNVATFDTDELLQREQVPDFTVYSGPDQGAPRLTGLSISPTTVDTSAGPATVQVKFEAEDALSGLAYPIAAVATPGWEPHGGHFPRGWETWPIRSGAGTPEKGTWVETLPLAEMAKPGTYGIRSVNIWDRAGNELTYDAAELEALGFPTEFTETGAGDTTPPEIAGLRVEPGSVGASRSWDVYVHLSDDLSGFAGPWEYPHRTIEDITMEIDGPQTFGWGYYWPVRVDGTDRDGSWEIRADVDPLSPPGAYSIGALIATDRAGNTTALRGSDLESRGWDLTLEDTH